MQELFYTSCTNYRPTLSNSFLKSPKNITSDRLYIELSTPLTVRALEEWFCARLLLKPLNNHGDYTGWYGGLFSSPWLLPGGVVTSWRECSQLFFLASSWEWWPPLSTRHSCKVKELLRARVYGYLANWLEFYESVVKLDLNTRKGGFVLFLLFLFSASQNLRGF